MTPHDPAPRTFQPSQQRPSSATLVDDDPARPVRWRDEADARERVVETIALLESAATALGAAALTPDDLRAARHTNQLLAEASPGRVVELADEFHRLLYARCANARMLAIVDEEMTLLRAVDRGPERLAPADVRRIVAEHDDIVKLIESDPTADTITYVLRAHRGRVCCL